MSEPSTGRSRIVGEMYEAYLGAHDLLVAGTNPNEVPAIAEFSSRLDSNTVFRFPSLNLELRGREAIERFMVEVRQSIGLRETSEQVIEHGNVVVSFNRTSTSGSDGAVPVVAVFLFDGEVVTEFWGFAGSPASDG